MWLVIGMGDLDIRETNTLSLGTQIVRFDWWFVFYKMVADCAAVAGGVYLCEIVVVIGCAGAPGDGIFSSLYSVANPVIAHVNGFGPF